MTDYLVSAIYRTLAEQGESVFTTPQSLEVVLARNNQSSPSEIAAIIAAVKHGVIPDLRSRPGTNIQELSEELAVRSGLPPHVAKWSLEVWKKALHHFDSRQPPTQVVVDELRAAIDGPPPVAPYRRGVTATILIALIGMVAGLLPGYLIPIGVQHGNVQAIRVRRLIEHREVTGTRMSPTEFTTWIGSLGAMGGLIGAAVGWLRAGFHRPTTIRIVAGVIGAMWAFDGAIFGVTYLGIIGALFGSMFVAAVMTYVAVTMGRFGVLLILKPLAWFVLPHFV